MIDLAQNPYPQPPRWLRKLPIISLVVTLAVCPVVALLVTRQVQSTKAAARSRQHWSEGFYAGEGKARYDRVYFQLPSAADMRSYAEVCCPSLAEGERKEWTDGFVSGYTKVYAKYGGPKPGSQQTPPPVFDKLPKWLLRARPNPK